MMWSVLDASFWMLDYSNGHHLPQELYNIVRVYWILMWLTWPSLQRDSSLEDSLPKRWWSQSQGAFVPQVLICFKDVRFSHWNLEIPMVEGCMFVGWRWPRMVLMAAPLPAMCWRPLHQRQRQRSQLLSWIHRFLRGKRMCHRFHGTISPQVWLVTLFSWRGVRLTLVGTSSSCKSFNLEASPCSEEILAFYSS